ncbi:MAG: peptide chain release factor N(5)-glutamine methyltransferase [Actinomycetota bacterium]|nr:peptide chain release factor N(5)-glutamine methyltransferase [Actinomycetota bacterium]
MTSSSATAAGTPPQAGGGYKSGTPAQAAGGWANSPAPLHLGDVVRGHARTLAAAGIDSSEADAFSLARHALGLSAAALRTAGTAGVAPERLDRLGRLVARRALRVPLQHLTGEAGFRRLMLTSRPGVFVPRPETEVLAGAAIELAHVAIARFGRAIVIEPCTGSGAVGLSIAHEVAGVCVIAADLDLAAVALARCNLARLRAAPGLAHGSTCEILAGDLLDPFPAELRGHVDVIVANPPYLTSAEVAACPPEVRDHDPRLALAAGDDGHVASDALLAAAAEWLRAGGTLLLEVAETRAAEVAARALRVGYGDIAVAADLAGRHRFVAARVTGQRSS